MIDDVEGIKKDVAEVKFLIHDLRVERFINEVIHYHVTVNTDLEVYNASQAQALHGEDLQELRIRALNQRKKLQEYSNAVRSFSPDKTILALGRDYIDTVYDICDLILDPRWGQAQKVLSFLPPDSRSVRSHAHYVNCIRWICAVHVRIQHFRDETSGKDLSRRFDMAAELQDFVRFVRGYVAEKSGARVEIQLGRMDSAVLEGNLSRFRRMFFNLVMNAVDGMKDRKVGILNVSATVDGDRVVMRVSDTGSGMPEAKIRQLLTDRESLDGELHSLGFVFVRQTVAAFSGDLSIDSEVGKGTTITISFPYLQGVMEVPSRTRECEKYEIVRDLEDPRSSGRAAWAKKGDVSKGDRNATCGEIIFADYKLSEAQFPGSVFALGVTEEHTIDFFTHRPYERDWNITHEDLSPMLYEAAVRGRLEEDEEKNPVLILKAPLNVREYFDFRDVPEADRSADRFVAMVHDEYVRIARKLIETGLPAEIGVHLTDVRKFFRESTELLEIEPFPLDLLARQRLTSEGDS